MKIIEVAAGIIVKNNKVLIARRKMDISNGGKWEFPGGKLKHNENIFSAIQREIKEEFGMDILPLKVLGEIETILTDRKKIRLIAILSKPINTIKFMLDHDEIDWITIEKTSFKIMGNADYQLIKIIFPILQQFVMKPE